ncbi:endo-1,4-beta-xylanase [Amnibacterium kyonggiense]|uniref:Beta-xylanase n=1 Tax=Amnibacterium kyonggiense TaxID=595671 RepID=A0A4R7FSC8_9MICO|nr:endo-1,4-beta-xylanase [Amnibacterium kyonggiense]TDS80648.1 GH35 family endo-1,4-beta-xylanase [Amnibacterium kyonggiense]
MTDRIPAHHRVYATVRVLDAAGEPLRDADVTVEQRRQAFGFGNIGFDLLPLVGGPAPHGAEDVEAFGTAEGLPLEVLEPAFLGLFNQVTLPFYWGRYEPERGVTDEERLRRTAQWFVDRGVTVKGHPLLWHTVTPAWQAALPLDEVERLQRERSRSLPAAFAGLIDVWDAINEAVIMPVFANGANRITDLAARKGRLETVRLAFEEARAGDPAATLLINDFDLSPAYERLIEEVLDAGIAVDAIGLQTHMHQGYRGEAATTAVLDRFARFGLPLHMTETSLVSGHLMPPEIEDLNDYRVPDWPTTAEGEARQADELVRHYRTLVAHRAVEVVNYWGITDAGAWLGAPIGLLREDGSRKPGYDALEALIRGDWWLPSTALRTDGDGAVRVTGFAGDFVVAGAGFEVPVALAAGAVDVTVRTRV